MKLGVGISALCSALQPFECILVVLFDALSLQVGQSDLNLGLDMALLRRTQIPAGRFGQVALYLLATGVIVTQHELGVGVTLVFGQIPDSVEVGVVIGLSRQQWRPHHQCEESGNYPF